MTKYQVEKILDALERTFIIDLIYPYAKSNVREIISRPKVFFTDLGIRNSITGKINELSIMNDKGKLFENAVQLHLQDLIRRRGNGELLFWRTRNQTEVDFIVKLVVDGKSQLMAYETKYTWNMENIPKSLVSFEEIYKRKISSTKVVTSNNYWELLKETF